MARQDSELAPLLDQFACVRLVQAYGLDLSLFQFDPELTFAVFFLNADRTLYGRYGTRISHGGNESVSLAGLRAAAEAALTLHAGYPANKAALAGKQGPPPRWPTPERIPQLPGPKAPADGSRGRCIHCHEIGLGNLLTMRKALEPIPDSVLWTYPNPVVLGLDFDPEHRAKLRTVPDGSPAFQAGLRAGDAIETANGQPVISIADVQWVLEHANAPGEVQVGISRDGSNQSVKLPLAADWRRKDDFTWRTIAWPLRLQILGFRPAALSEAERTRFGLKPDEAALKVVELPPGWLKEANRAAEKAGLKKGDLIVAFEGRSAFTEKDLLAFAVQQRKAGETMTVTVRRGDKRLDLRFAVK